MKCVFSFFFLMTSLVSAQTYDLYNIIRHEYAFAEKASNATTRDAFLYFIADEGIIFRPHPLNGKEFLTKSESNNGWLIWYPERASISESGDIGYTTGPASFRRSKNDSIDIWFGNFCTVWRKQKDNSWKFLIDFGISNPKPTGTIKPLIIPQDISNNSNPLTDLGEKSLIRNLENGFQESNSSQKMENYFIGSRFLFEGLNPVDGVKDIDKLFIEKKLFYSDYSLIDGEISSTRDFCYAYGIVKYHDLITNNVNEYYYLRVWQKQQGSWKITIEVWNEKPKS